MPVWRECRGPGGWPSVLGRNVHSHERPAPFTPAWGSLMGLAQIGAPTLNPAQLLVSPQSPGLQWGLTRMSLKPRHPHTGSATPRYFLSSPCSSELSPSNSLLSPCPPPSVLRAIGWGIPVLRGHCRRVTLSSGPVASPPPTLERGLMYSPASLEIRKVNQLCLELGSHN